VGTSIGVPQFSTLLGSSMTRPPSQSTTASVPDRAAYDGAPSIEDGMQSRLAEDERRISFEASRRRVAAVTAPRSLARSQAVPIESSPYRRASSDAGSGSWQPVAGAPLRGAEIADARR
jgi:hypothetical protein